MQRMRLQVNGESVEAVVEPQELLLDFLRDRLGLKGPKRSCEVQVCGTCTVLVDGLPVSACCMLACEAEGREVLTIEGFARAAGVRGVPGGIHTPRGAPVRLLHGRLRPDAEGAARQRRARERGGDPPRARLERVPLHRLPVDPGRRAGPRGRRVSATVDQLFTEVGRSVDRRDADAKMRGEAAFAGDVEVPRMLHGKVLRSELAHARIVGIDTTEAEAMPGRRVRHDRRRPARDRQLRARAEGPARARARPRALRRRACRGGGRRDRGRGRGGAALDRRGVRRAAGGRVDRGRACR